jgi:hypothetical protein
MKHTILALLCIIFIGCESSDTSNGSTSSSESSSSTLAKGGTASNPTNVSLGVNYQISTNNSYNYYKYKGTEDETLIITLNTDHELTENQSLGCSMNPEAGDKVMVYDKDLNLVKAMSTCRTRLTLTYEFDTSSIIRVNYREAYFGEDRYLTITSNKK